MNRDEILSKSRMENKGKDLYERDIQTSAGNIGAVVALLLATLFYVIQIFVGGGLNYGLYAIVFSVSASGAWVKVYHMKRRRDMIYAVIHTVVTLIFSGAHIYQMIQSSGIL